MPLIGSSGKIFSKEQKIGFILLSCFAVLALGLGVTQIRNAMYSPLSLNNAVPLFVKDDITNPDYLRYRDTDHDGLSDFDELYIYGTSSYVADTDSDGVSDKQEVERGVNPNCAEGSDCANIITDAEWTTASSTIDVAVPDPGAPPVDINVALGDPTMLRDLLRTSGMDEKTLSQISDEELLVLVEEFMKANSTAITAQSQ